jgi:protein-S-isoprenylcysteine O-methyltransferase Ste14
MTAFITAKALIFATAFIGGWIWVIRSIQPLSREWDAMLPSWPAWLGPAVLATGVVGVIVCISLFVVRGRGTPALFDAPVKFVAVGPYRYVRNPMYWSAVAIFSGVALSAHSLAALAFVPAWWLLIHTVVVLIEEPGLHRRFGDTYADYCERVPRWIPRFIQ